MPMLTATISGSLLRPDLAAGAMTVTIHAVADGARLEYSGTVIAGSIPVKIRTDGTARVTIPQLPQAGLTPSGALWRLRFKSGHYVDHWDFTLTTNTTWDAIVDVSNVPLTSSIQAAVQAAAAAAAASAAAASASATAAAGSAASASAIADPTGGYAHQIGNSNGSDDTTVLNGILSTAGFYRGTPGQNYLISAPLVLRSNTVLDMTGCTVTLKASSNCNMVNNRAVSTVQRSVTDAAITTGTAVLTSATAAFTSADIGRSVVVTNALAPSGGTPGPLCVQIVSINSGTSVNVSANASNTVSAAACSIYDRDTDITIIGGTWNRGANGGTAFAAHSLRFRRIDRLNIIGPRITSTAGKYAIDLGSTTRFRVMEISLDNFSDGVHIEGDCQYGYIGQIDGTTGDDFIPMTARQAPTFTAYEDVAGDIRDIVVDSLTIKSSLSPVKLLGGAGTVISGIKVRNVLNEGTGQSSIGGEDPTLYVQDIRDVLVDGYSTAANVGFNVISNVSDLTVRNLRMTSANSSVYGVNVKANSTLTSLVVDGVSYLGASASGAIVRLEASTSTIGRVKIANVYMTPGAGSNILFASAAAIVTTAILDKCTIIGGGGFANFSSGGTLTTLRLLNCESSGSSWIADLATATDVLMFGTSNPSAGSGSFNVRAAGSLKVRGEGNIISGNAAVAAGGVFTSYCPDVPYVAVTGAVPTIAAAAGAGTSPTVSITGDDRAGSISITAGSSPAAGDLATITFTRNPPNGTRQIMLTPTSSVAAGINPYIGTKAAGNFKLSCQAAPTAAAVYTFDYLIVP